MHLDEGIDILEDLRALVSVVDQRRLPQDEVLHLRWQRIPLNDNGAPKARCSRAPMPPILLIRIKATCIGHLEDAAVI